MCAKPAAVLALKHHRLLELVRRDASFFEEQFDDPNRHDVRNSAWNRQTRPLVAQPRCDAPCGRLTRARGDIRIDKSPRTDRIGRASADDWTGLSNRACPHPAPQAETLLPHRPALDAGRDVSTIAVGVRHVRQIGVKGNDHPRRPRPPITPRGARTSVSPQLDFPAQGIFEIWFGHVAHEETRAPPTRGRHRTEVQISGRGACRHQRVGVIERSLPRVSTHDLGSDTAPNQLHRGPDS